MTFCPPLIFAYFASEPAAFPPPPVILWPWLILVAAFGACVGSFLNVVIYRVPEGRSIVSPPSSCPKCGHRLAAYDNVPIFGWLWLGGKCRYCKTAISIQYPIIEALTALFFGGLFFCYYLSPLWPAWSQAGLAETWPALVVHLVLIGALVASTVIDFRLYIIALPIPWTVTVLALIALPVAAVFLPGMEAVSPLADGRWLAATVGAAIGLIVSCALLYLGVLPRSFDEDPEAHDELGTKADADAAAPALEGSSLAVGAPVVMDTPELPVTPPSETTPPADAPTPTSTPETPAIDPESFLTYPHPRREIAKEIVFLALPILGAALAYQFFPVHAMRYALPVRVFGGVLLGYLAGGGMIWITRVLGTLGFDKEAMGLGDVHLLAAIGAVLGWQAAGIVFFIAPFLGLGSYAAVALVTKLAKGSVRVIPYGPYLAAATLFFMAFHGTVMDLLNRLLSNGAGK